MKNYQLAIYQPEGPTPPPDALATIMREVGAVIADAKAQGVWVFNGGLTPPSSATVVRTRGEESLLSDGPFAESKEFIGGVVVVRVAELDQALAWARRLSRATTLPIEVRPFQGNA